MQPTPGTSKPFRLAAIRRLVMPTLVLTIAACGDAPTEPPRAHEHVAFSKVGSHKGQLLYTSGSSEAIVHMMDPATKHVVKISPGAAGSWSPDYTMIAFSKGPLDGLYIMNADGSNEKQLVLMPTVFGSAFSPDGGHIAFIAAAGGNLQVHTIEIATGNVTQLTNLTGVGTRVSWSRDGKKVLFDRSYSSNPNLFTVAPDGTGLTQLTYCNVVCSDGQYSPDGKAIAFVHDNQVARMTAAGAKIKMLTSAAEPQPYWPSWSPSGKQLAYERSAGNQNNVWVLTLADGSSAPLLVSRLDETTPNWSH